MDIVAIVPMKGNSERVPGKNLRPMNGKPLFYWIIKELTELRFPVYVDTDSENIQKAVKEHFSQVKIIRRPDYLCGDDVSMNKILEYDISKIEGEHFIQTHSTSPLLSSKTIMSAVKTYFDNLGQYDSLFSISAIQARCFRSNGEPINHNPKELIQTQFLEPVFVENSGFYIFSRDSFGKENKRIGIRPYLFPISQYEAIDIDNEEDFNAADILCSAMKGRLQ